MNSIISRLAGIGLVPMNTVLLQVRGRRSGEMRSTAVSWVEHEGQRYLVAPRGNTEWVRNVKAASGEAVLKSRKSGAASVSKKSRSSSALRSSRPISRRPPWSPNANSASTLTHRSKSSKRSPRTTRCSESRMLRRGEASIDYRTSDVGESRCLSETRSSQKMPRPRARISTGLATLWALRLPIIPERRIPPPDRLSEPLLHRQVPPGDAFRGMAGDAVEHGAQHLGRP